MHIQVSSLFSWKCRLMMVMRYEQHAIGQWSKQNKLQTHCLCISGKPVKILGSFNVLCPPSLRRSQRASPVAKSYKLKTSAILFLHSWLRYTILIQAKPFL